MSFLKRVVRVLAGVVAACVAATTILVLFALLSWDDLNGDRIGARLTEAGLFIINSAPYVTVCAALPGLLVALFAELRKIAGWTFYALAGLVIAAGSFLVLGLLQAYELIALLASGLVGGLVYWALSGRFAAA